MKNWCILAFLPFILSCQERRQEYADLIPIEVGDVTVAFIYEENGKQGLLDTNKAVILKAQFDKIDVWPENGLLAVDSGGYEVDGGDYLDYKYNKIGLINTSGEVLFKPQFDELIIADSAAVVRKDSLYGYVNQKGKWISKPKYKKASPFYKGTAVVKEAEKFLLIDKQLKLVSPIMFDTVWSFKNDIAVVEKDSKFGYVNHSGKLILPLDNYFGISDFNWYYGMFRKEDNKWYIVDTTGKVVIEQGFDEVSINNRNDTIIADGIINGKKVQVKLKNYSM